MASLPASGGESSPQAAANVILSDLSQVNLGSDWVVSTGDNVCGVSGARQISNPAKLSYSSLLASTPELKEMKKKGISKESPEGLVLHNKGVDRVRKAAKTVMQEKGHCSVWKAIRSKKGVSVPDITSAVRAKL